MDPAWLRALIETARAEDLEGAGLATTPAKKGDATTRTLVDADKVGSAQLVARETLTLAGLPLLPLILEVYGHPDPANAVLADNKDGTCVPAGAQIATLHGPISVLLQAERVMLNFLQRLSGIATQTALYKAALEGSETVLLDTRKTTPGWRVLEKYAVACGGGYNHRLGLYDRVMLKDNHLAAAGATAGERLAAAVRMARETNPDLPIEVEIDHLEQIEPVLEAGADVLLLDNFSPENLRKAVEMIGERAFTEASGNVTLETLPALGKLGLDFISSGALIHKAHWCDIGLDWEMEPRAPKQQQEAATDAQPA